MPEAPRGFVFDGAGIWCKWPSRPTVAISARSGLGWVALDCQHGFVQSGDLPLLLQMLAQERAVGYVRVMDGSPAQMGWALDSGASGVIVPMIETSAQAEAIVDACTYPPEGTRSWGPLSVDGGRPDVSGDPLPGRPATFAMIETARGLENLEAIAQVEGLSGVFIGPWDLALSLGVTVESLLDESEIAPVILHAAEVCEKNGKLAGIYAGSVERSLKLRAAGFDLIAVASDEQLYTEAVRRLADECTTADIALSR